MCLCLRLPLEDFISAPQQQQTPGHGSLRRLLACCFHHRPTVLPDGGFHCSLSSLVFFQLERSPVMWLSPLPLGNYPLSLQITPPCSSEQHYEHFGRCCTKCEPGKYMSAKCTSTSGTVCQPCGPNEYMDVWNEEEKCLLHKICDQGKALIEVNPGNGTSQRQCACISGYHWNEDCDCCRRNTKCLPGSGVKHPVQQNKDTVCMPCPSGYFSNVSSATDACKTWTNCTALGTEEKSPGNSWADVVCKKQLKMHAQDETNTLFYILITPLLLVALVGIAAFAIFYHSKGKSLTDLQYWANEICKQIKRTKDSPHDTFVNTNVASPAGLRLLGRTYLLDLDEYSFSEDACYQHGHIVNGKGGPDTIHYESGEDFPTLSLAIVSEDDRFRQIPTEDEYMDRMTQGPCYFPLLSRPENKPVPPFSEPLEVGENDSLSQCFTGTESLMDSTNYCCSDSSYVMDPIHDPSHKCLQNYCHQSTCSNMGDVDNQGIGTSLLIPKETIRCTACCVSCRESPNKAGSATHSLKESGPFPPCSCGLDFPSEDHNGSASNAGVRNDPSDGNGMRKQNAKRPSESKCSTSDLPAASGNVTGNGNSTFISSGQVMNFKGEIIVVYVSQNSQEGSMSPGSSDDSLGSPVQEENLNCCETFAGNAHQYKEKYAEMNSYHSVGNEPQSTVREYKRTSGPIVQEENDEDQNRKLFYNEASQPVQEEGKPGQFPKQTLH
ncbi:tumor necrosis factor receptor superfamily member 11A isoform X2 [Rhineura floridana]|uniref:tumor necrosis factor receptor superfamily member 11A isoform X2 n=1 Tax=Rhineura floridana TaxID=261503 RepID=UPI002AC80DF6|nr:tumor necrosis factor receptor superfamily member 11A isoform X2 [Rhineura floridana]